MADSNPARRELEEWVERWLKANQDAEAAGDWKALADFYADDATYGWNIGPKEDVMCIGKKEIRDVALGLEMDGSGFGLGLCPGLLFGLGGETRRFGFFCGLAFGLQPGRFLGVPRNNQSAVILQGLPRQVAPGQQAQLAFQFLEHEVGHPGGG